MCLALDSCNLLLPPSMVFVPSRRARTRFHWRLRSLWRWHPASARLHAHLSSSASEPSSCPFDFLVVAAVSTFCAAALVLSLWMLLLARPDVVARLSGLPSSSRCPHRQPSFASPCWCPRLGPRRRTGCLVDDLVFQAFFFLRFLASFFYSTGGVAFIGTSLMIYVHDAGLGSLRSAASGPPLGGARFSRSSEKPFAGSPRGWVQSAGFAPSASCLRLATGVAPPHFAWTVPVRVSFRPHPLPLQQTCPL